MPDYETEDDRNEGRSISLPRSLWAHLSARARDEGKTLSAYVRQLAELDETATTRAAQEAGR